MGISSNSFFDSLTVIYRELLRKLIGVNQSYKNCFSVEQIERLGSCWDSFLKEISLHLEREGEYFRGNQLSLLAKAAQNVDATNSNVQHNPEEIFILYKEQILKDIELHDKPHLFDGLKTTVIHYFEKEEIEQML